MKTKKGRTVTHKTLSIYDEIDGYVKAMSGVTEQMLGTNYAKEDTIETDELGYIEPPKMKEYFKRPKVMVGKLEVPPHLLDYTLKVIEEVRNLDKE